MRCGILPGFLLLPLLLICTVQAEEPKVPEGFVAIFNGKDLTGWKVMGGKKEVWGVDHGILFCDKGGGGWILSEKEYGNFELRVDYRWTKEGGNSGVALRTPAEGNPAYVGMEIQLIDDENWEKVHKFKLQPWQQTGSIYEVQASKKQANKPINEWNSMKLICQGSKITIEQNGETITEANLQDYKESKGKKHPGILRQKGFVGFQSYNYRVDFRNIFIKELD